MNIKELFLSDLDLSDVDSWSDDYIAKINYNFTVIKNGRKKGPQGLQGPVGLDGNQGDIGDTGVDGIQGPEGIQGPDGLTIWNRIGNDSDNFNNESVIPISNVSQLNTLLPTAHIILGRATSPSIPNDIDINGNIYIADINTTYISQSNSAPESNDVPDNNTEVPILKINTTEDTLGNMRKHIRIVDYNDTNNFGEIYFNLNSGTSIKSSGTLNLKSDYFNIILNGVNTVSIGNGITNINSSLSYFSNVEIDINSSLIFNIGSPVLNNVMKSNDSFGNAVWSSITSSDLSLVGGGLPLGSIIKVPLDIFTNPNNFDVVYTDINQQYNTTSGNVVIRSTIGRGYGDYSGWYLCNGINWGEEGFEIGGMLNISFSDIFENIPNLSSSFKVNGNVIFGDDTNKVLASSSISMNSSNLTSIMSVDDTDYTAYINLMPFASDHNDILLNRNFVHIIYLDNPGLCQHVEIIS